MKRAPTISELQAAYKQFPNQSVAVCSKAQKQGKLILHPRSLVCSYCRVNSKDSVIDFPKELEVS